MSHYCQFCDKEMVIDAQVVHVKGYITCGGTACTASAKENSSYYEKKAFEKEHPKEIETQIVLFQTENPYSPESWRIVEPKDYPEFISDPDTLAIMLKGEIANVYKANQKDMIYYQAKRLKDVKKELGSILNA